MTTLNSRLQLALIKRKKSKNALQKGFTLVELLIVVVILGVLSSVALPAFLNQTGKAKVNASNASATAAAKACEVFLVADEPDATYTAPDGVTVDPGCAYGATFTSTVEGVTNAVATLGESGGITVVSATEDGQTDEEEEEG